MTKTDRQWRLARPAPHGEAVTEAHFELTEASVPAPAEGQVLARTLYLSLDPYMRGRMSPAPSYAPSVKPGEVMVGRAVARIEESRHGDFTPGDMVLAEPGWREWSVQDGADLLLVDPALGPVSHALGLRGMPGITAYSGLLDIGRPEAGQTVVVTAAAGAVGSVVGQIAKIKGCRTIGIAGSAAKVRFCTETLGFDAAFDYKTCPDLAAAIGEAAPDGVHVFFDNAGGTIHIAVATHLALFGRIIICGVMSQNNPQPGSEPAPYDFRLILTKRATMQGMLVSDFADLFEQARADLAGWYAEGKLTCHETIAEGIEAAPAAFMGLLKGENLGKQLVRVAAEG